MGFLARLFGWEKPTPVQETETPKTIKMQPQPVHVNPTAGKRKDRNLARIARLELALQQEGREWKRKQILSEMKKRKALQAIEDGEDN